MLSPAESDELGKELQQAAKAAQKLLKCGLRRLKEKAGPTRKIVALWELAGSGKTLYHIARAIDRTPDGIRNRSIRLGVPVKSSAATRKIRG
jgi:hypothetical protein